MSVFPEKMDKLDPKNVADSLQSIESYLSYMCERIEHTITNINKNSASAKDISKLQEKIESLKQMLNNK